MPIEIVPKRKTDRSRSKDKMKKKMNDFNIKQSPETRSQYFVTEGNLLMISEDTHGLCANRYFLPATRFFVTERRRNCVFL